MNNNDEFKFKSIIWKYNGIEDIKSKILIYINVCKDKLQSSCSAQSYNVKIKIRSYVGYI